MTWHSGNEYSGRDMARMQTEAAERVREMQERNRRVVDMSPTSHSGHFSVPTTKPALPAPQSHTSSGGNSSGSNGNGGGGLFSALGGGLGGLGSLGGLITGGTDGPLSKALEALGIDNDKIIIMVLLLILINNKADKKLILALCYLLI